MSEKVRKKGNISRKAEASEIYPRPIEGRKAFFKNPPLEGKRMFPK